MWAGGWDVLHPVRATIIVMTPTPNNTISTAVLIDFMYFTSFFFHFFWLLLFLHLNQSLPISDKLLKLALKFWDLFLYLCDLSIALLFC